MSQRSFQLSTSPAVGCDTWAGDRVYADPSFSDCRCIVLSTGVLVTKIVKVGGSRRPSNDPTQLLIHPLLNDLSHFVHMGALAREDANRGFAARVPIVERGTWELTEMKIRRE